MVTVSIVSVGVSSGVSRVRVLNTNIVVCGWSRVGTRVSYWPLTEPQPSSRRICGTSSSPSGCRRESRSATRGQTSAGYPSPTISQPHPSSIGASSGPGIGTRGVWGVFFSVPTSCGPTPSVPWLRVLVLWSYTGCRIQLTSSSPGPVTTGRTGLSPCTRVRPTPVKTNVPPLTIKVVVGVVCTVSCLSVRCWPLRGPDPKVRPTSCVLLFSTRDFGRGTWPIIPETTLALDERRLLLLVLFTIIIYVPKTYPDNLWSH